MVNITPIAKLERIDSLAKTSGVKDSGSNMFKSIFEDSIKNVIDTNNQVAADVQSLATGETDDLHTLGIDQTKAQLSISMLVQLRNRFLESYNELMRINL